MDCARHTPAFLSMGWGAGQTLATGAELSLVFHPLPPFSPDSPKDGETDDGSGCAARHWPRGNGRPIRAVFAVKYRTTSPAGKALTVSIGGKISIDDPAWSSLLDSNFQNIGKDVATSVALHSSASFVSMQTHMILPHMRFHLDNASDISIVFDYYASLWGG